MREALKGLPFDIGNLEAAGVLKPSESGYKIAYTVFTSDDLKRIYAASAGYGASLADAFIAAAPRFERIFQRYPYRQLRSDLAFVTVAGYILNWDGLRIGTELGMRAEPTVRPNGDRYILWSKEKGAGLSTMAMYWGSHSSNPDGNVRFTTFGDSQSQPRLGGIPDIYFGAMMGPRNLRERPDLSGAVTAQVIRVFDKVMELEGGIMLALRDGPKRLPELRVAVPTLEADFDQAIGVLKEAHYISENNGLYSTQVVVLTEADRPMLDEIRALGREILTIWLRANHSQIQRDLGGLQITQAGMDFTYSFNEIWHYIFGFTTKELAENGFYTDPRADGRTHTGFVPVVFQADLVPMP